MVVRQLRERYTPALRWALANVMIAIGAGLVFLLFSLLVATRLGSEFLPALEEGNFWIRAQMPPTISLDDGKEATRKMREILLRHPEVITVVSQHGRPDNGSRRLALLQCRTLRAAQTLRSMASQSRQGEADRRFCKRSSRTNSPASASTSRNIFRTTSRKPSRA